MDRYGGRRSLRATVGLLSSSLRSLLPGNASFLRPTTRCKMKPSWSPLMFSVDPRSLSDHRTDPDRSTTHTDVRVRPFPCLRTHVIGWDLTQLPAVRQSRGQRKSATNRAWTFKLNYLCSRTCFSYVWKLVDANKKIFLKIFLDLNNIVNIISNNAEKNQNAKLQLWD